MRRRKSWIAWSASPPRKTKLELPTPGNVQVSGMSREPPQRPSGALDVVRALGHSQAVQLRWNRDLSRIDLSRADLSRPVRAIVCGFLALFACIAPADAAQAIDGTRLTWPWALPFAGLLMSIATGPLLYRRLWHHHYGKIAFAWGALTLAPLAAIEGTPVALAGLAHALLGEYMSFIVLLFALYVVAGGIFVTGNLRGTPLVNAAVLMLGTAIASIVGTTGAAMILIRPLIRANKARRHIAHVVVFFIFLVANIGGALSPLGDPPLFVGFLRGVDFFWTTTHLLAPTLLAAAVVLAIFVVVDLWFYRLDRRVAVVGEPLPPMSVKIRGRVNLPLIAVMIGVILMSGMWKPGIVFDVYGTKLALESLTRDGVLVLVAVASLILTPDEHREANDFTWEPIREVAILFAGIFVCIVPVLAMLDAGHGGAFAWLLDAVTGPDGRPRELAYFWVTGLLSAFLDNAPTYLVFFELAGGEARTLMSDLAPTLAAISMGAVYMGALTYIGNAPNFMVYAIATERGIPMPSFFGYMLWSLAVLGPVLALVTLVFVAPN
jgi:Na+/H+ antiporter NhaD/arsenite permease-like protein